MIRDTDARATLKADRIDYWLGVGAQPTEKVRVLIKKYGTNGTHLDQQKAAVERTKALKPTAPPPMVVPKPKPADEPAPSDAAPSSEGEAPAAAEQADAPVDGGEASGE